MDVPADPDEALAAAVEELYAAAPAEFVATRTALAKGLRTAKHRDAATQLTGMRKPSVSAGAVNALVRAQDPVVRRLVELGGQLRHATSALDGRALAALRTDRDELLRDWVRAAAGHGGGSLTSAVEAEVRDTAVAALADADAAEVATSGHLTRALSYSGFGEVDLADAVARTSTGVVLTRIEGGRVDGEPVDAEPDDAEDPADEEPDAEDDDAEGAVDVSDLEMELDEAEKVVAAARADRRRATSSETEAEERVEETAELLTGAEEALRQAQAGLEAAREAHDQALESLTEAREGRGRADEALEAARERRDRARVALEEAEDA